jgi:hypothetical protein
MKCARASSVETTSLGTPATISTYATAHIYHKSDIFALQRLCKYFKLILVLQICPLHFLNFLCIILYIHVYIHIISVLSSINQLKIFPS